MPRASFHIPTWKDDPSQAQIRYCEILFNDLGFTRPQRNSYLTELAGREIRYIADLSKIECSRAIERLKEQKERGSALNA